MRSRLALSTALLVALSVLGCTGKLGGFGTPGLDSGRSSADAGSPLDANGGADVPASGDAAAVDDGPADAPIDAGACVRGTLAEALNTVTVSLGSPAARVLSAPTADGGTVLAWSGPGGVHVTRVSATGARMGTDAVVPGTSVEALAVRGDVWGVLVARSPDILAFVGIAPAGSISFDRVLVGGVDHSVTGNEWYGALPEARLAATPTGFGAYFTIQRLWPDGIAHQGDTLQFFAADGGEDRSGGWDWGCSHSLAVRLGHDGSSAGAACVSDCFPGKGVYFNHTTEVFADPSGDCSGSSGSALGAIVGTATGFVIAFTSAEGRTSSDVGIVGIGRGGRPGRPDWLTSDDVADGAAHLGSFEGGLVAGWTAGSSSFLVRLDDTGAPVDSPEAVSASLGQASDFFSWPNGDVGWSEPASGDARLFRLRACP